MSGNTAAQFSFEDVEGTDFFVIDNQNLCANCVNVTFPAAAAGAYNIDFNGFNLEPIAPYFTGYSEEYEGSNQFSIGATVAGVLKNVLSGTCANITIFATPGTSSAVFQCQLANAASSVITVPPPPPSGGPLNFYLIFVGSTSSPVGLTATNDYANITLDWYASVSTNPYSPQSFVSVPSVVTESEGTAVDALDSARLTPNVIQQPSATVAAGYVVSQSPVAGASVPAYWPVDLVVSSGPPPISIPNVVNLSQSAAITDLQAASLAVTQVTLVTSSAGQTGIVIGQSPAAGTNVAAGTAVNLTVGAGPPATPANIVYTGNGTASSNFTYSLYDVDGLPFSGNAFANDAGGFDANGNPITINMTYSSLGVGPVVCGSTPECFQAFSHPNGQLFIYTCPVGSQGCSAAQGTLGGPNDGIFAGSSLAALNASSVNTATIQITYTQTQSTNPSTGITTFTPDAPPVYFIVTGTSAAPQGAPPGDGSSVQICYGGAFGCGAFSTTTGFTAGPYFNSFQVDWTATLSATPFEPPAGSIAVPNLVGLTRSVATTALATAGLVLGTVTQRASTTVPAGDVISQSPAAGTSASDGSSVNLVLSSGPPLVSVPSVVGDTQSTATSTITAANLIVGSVTQQSSMKFGPGVVLSQIPAAGASAASGSAVNLVVSSGSTCADLLLVKAAFGSKLGQTAYNPVADVNDDGVVNILDLSAVARALPAGTVCD